MFLMTSLFVTDMKAQGGDLTATPYARVQDGDTSEIKTFVRTKSGWWNSFRIAFGGDFYSASVWTEGGELLPKRLRRNDLFFSREVMVTGDDRWQMIDQHPAVSSRGLGGFPCFDVYYGAGEFILHKSGDDIHARSVVVFAALDGIVRSLLFDTVGTFGYNLLATTELGSVYRIDSTGKAIKLANVNEDIKAADIVPLGPEYGPFAGQMIFVSRFLGRFRSVDSSGNVFEVDAGRDLPGTEALLVLPQSAGQNQTREEGSYLLHWRIPVQNAYVINRLTVDAYALLAVIRRSRDEIWTLERRDSHFEAKYQFDLPAQVDEITLLTPARLPSGGSCPATPLR
jgi:hypothetical protein